MKNKSFILSGGGTGGHIYPAVSIADALKAKYPDADFLFVGAADRMEMQKVPQCGYPIRGLWISGMQRKWSIKNLLLPVKLVSSLVTAYFIIKKQQPDIAIGTGGYASAALLKMASWMGVPTLIQEQNSYPGITNKWLANNASKICVAYPNLERFFPKEKIVFTGNPIRKNIGELTADKHEAYQYFNLQPHKKTVLVIGGSLGAKDINELLAENVSFFEKQQIQLLWQCGQLYYDRFKDLESENVKIKAYLQRMDLAYNVAEVIISRAGASTVSELTLVGKPVIFIPSPNVAEDHQTKNAQALVSNNAAVMIAQKEAKVQFQSVFEELINDNEKQESLSRHIAAMAKPNATADIVNEIEKIIGA